jgi:hypothetical protein
MYSAKVFRRRSSCPVYDPVTPLNGMAALYVRLGQGSDLHACPEGASGRFVPVPPLALRAQGALHSRYKDSREEVAHVGDLWCAPPGHTARCDEDCEYESPTTHTEFGQMSPLVWWIRDNPFGGARLAGRDRKRKLWGYQREI